MKNLLTFDEFINESINIKSIVSAPIKLKTFEVASEDCPNYYKWLDASRIGDKIDEGWRLPTNDEFCIILDELVSKRLGNFKINNGKLSDSIRIIYPNDPKTGMQKGHMWSPEFYYWTSHKWSGSKCGSYCPSQFIIEGLDKNTTSSKYPFTISEKTEKYSVRLVRSL